MEDKLNLAEEYLKIKESPYYFATKYLKIKTDEGLIDFTTRHSEEEFNNIFKNNCK